MPYIKFTAHVDDEKKKKKIWSIWCQVENLNIMIIKTVYCIVELALYVASTLLVPL